MKTLTNVNVTSFGEAASASRTARQQEGDYGDGCVVHENQSRSHEPWNRVCVPDSMP